VYLIKTSNKFEKDFVRCVKRNYQIDSLGKVVELLEINGKLPQNYRPHLLSGNYTGFWECHIKSNWLLIWRQNDKTRVIELVRTGTHSDLFR
jgi:mRNA interferase YafQ